MAKHYTSLTYKNGLKDGVPIGLGYFPVAFAFGVKASILGLPIYITMLISMTNLTSAGQLSGLNIIAAGGSVIEIIITQLVINSRYFLMNLTLSQKLDDSFTFGKRFLSPATMTDEIFGVSASKAQPLGTKYLFGLSLIPYIGWAIGTLCGAVAGDILPKIITTALGIALYAMFIAIIIKPSMKNAGVLVTVLISAVISCLMFYLKFFEFISNDIKIIVSALITSSVMAILFPVKPPNVTAETDKEELCPN